MTAGSPSLRDEATAGLARGWSYTPLRGKAPFLHAWNSQPPTTLEDLCRWCAAGHNLGLRTGAVSGVTVVDFDFGGFDEDAADARRDLTGAALTTALDQLAKERAIAESMFELAPPTAIVRTGGDSGVNRHVYVAHVQGLGNSTSKLARHVDVRGDGGQVVAVGSIHPDTGRAYEWLVPPAAAPLPQIPRAWLDALRAKDAAPRLAPPPLSGPPLGYAASALAREADALSAAPEGTRNDTLNRAAFNLGQLVGGGALGEGDVTCSLATAALNAGLPEREVARTLRSGLEAGRKQPRAAPARSERLPPRPNQRTAAAPVSTRQPDVLVPGAHTTPHGYREVGDDEFARTLLDALPHGAVYVRGGVPGELVGDRGAISFQPLTNERTRLLIDHNERLCRWVLRTKKGVEKCVRMFVPSSTDHAKLVLACAVSHPNVPEIVAITRCPSFAGPEFTRLQPGFNPGHRVFFDEHPKLRGIQPIRDKTRISSVLENLLVDFPFQSIADWQSFIALLLVPIVRLAFQGNLPMHLVLSCMERSGKTKLVELVLGRIIQGASIPALALSDNEDEREKRILAVLIAGTPIVHLDNLRAHLDSAVLSSLITAEVFHGRLLGTNKMASVRNDVVLVGSGNNVRASSEVSKRIVPIRLLPKTDKPESRTDFAHPDLPGYLEEVRPQVVGALLGMVDNWLSAGRPQGVVPFGGFEGYAATVGGILGVQGYDQFLSNRADWVGDADVHGGDLESLVDAWWQKHGDNSVSPQTVFDLARVLDLFPEIVGGADIHKARSVFGRRTLMGAAQRPVGHWRIVATGKGSSRRYRLVPLDEVRP